MGPHGAVFQELIGGAKMKVLLFWFAASILLVVALVMRGWAEALHEKLKAKLRARQERQREARRQVLRKSGWR